MTPLREGYALPRNREVVSPELALVDPELAASARADLPEPRAMSAERVVSAAEVDGHRLAFTALSDAALVIDDEFVKPVAEGGRSWRVLIGVAVVTVLSLLFFDVRVAGRQDTRVCGNVAGAALTPLDARSPAKRACPET